ncbi:beta-N-acetylglucosaminidase/nitrogen fixation protein [Pullulanibacillus pueri]|uniref:Beta-N-acetylglucosaminidase n=1 Tax=Pullulanibacillus pueri TaxID=1437324 RepID=A0A8J2ZU00_9BACL|nr:glucosaminidase domain-containing protein [Pullulanibacillus pueri]MBM7683613.1 beta-N-acetylglucosaminidase/nitrogen fixation protein [Pullulanibacillus pueri]GGH76552.1 hypothetical protein GCM10007096_07150 [Pullulanibacillus pueri]
MKFGKLGAVFLAIVLLLSISPFYAKADSNDTIVSKSDAGTAIVYGQEGSDTVDILKEETPESEILVSVPSLTKVSIEETNSDYSKVSYTDEKTGKTWVGYITNDSFVEPSISRDDQNVENSDQQGTDQDKSEDSNEAQDQQSQDTVAENKDQSQQSDETTTESDKNSDQAATENDQKEAEDDSVSDDQKSAEESKDSKVENSSDSDKSVAEDKTTTVQPRILMARTMSVKQATLHGIALKDKTNVYEKTTGSKVLKSYDQGSVLKYETYSSDWYKCVVKINGKYQTGYIKKTDVENEVSKQTTVHGIGLDSSTKVYSKASTSSKTLKTYAQGSVLKYKTFTSGWYECTVIIKGKATTGYINKSDVENIVTKQETLHGIGKGTTKIYSKASTSSSVLKSYAQGSVLKYQTFTSGWYECTVYINGKKRTGYIQKSAVENSVTKQETLHGVGKSTTKVYSKASTSSSALKSYPQGSVLKYQTFTSGWYECTVYINGKKTTGYINKNDVENSVSKQETLHGIGIKSPTNVYTYASTSSKVLKSYKRGASLKYKTFTSEWYECTVILNGKSVTGYIKKTDVGQQLSTNYGVSFNDMVDLEMTRSPDTDLMIGYLREDAFGSISGSTGTIKGTDWRVRSDTNTDADVLGYLQNGARVEILKRIKVGNYYWYEIKCVVASRSAYRNEVAYFLDPNNFAKGTPEYLQFLNLTSSAGLNVSEVNENILKGNGIFEGKAQSFIDAGKKYSVNEIYLISHAFLETGNGKSELANGIKVNIRLDSKGNVVFADNGEKEVDVLPSNAKKYDAIVYNMYGIGAVNDDVIHGGAREAFNRGWITPEDAIIGGAQFVSDNYIHAGQDTLYKMRWNPDTANIWHQYATDIGWAVKQTYNISNLYDSLDSYTLVYDVPVYK